MPFINSHNRTIRVSRANKAILDRAERFGYNNLTSDEREIYLDMKRKETSLTNPINKTFYIVRVNGNWKLLDENFKDIGYPLSDKPSLVERIKREYNDRLVFVSKGAREPVDGNYKIEVM